MQSMTSHSLCVFAAHGSSDSIVNENDDEVISTRTTNYVFKGKGLYAISCSCASSLLPELSRIGISIFVGYDDDFRLSGDAGVFVNCALSGFRSFAEGKSFGQVQSDMLASLMRLFEKPETVQIHLKRCCCYGTRSLLFFMVSLKPLSQI